jgi:hypothetical protein
MKKTEDVSEQTKKYNEVPTDKFKNPLAPKH